MIGLFEIEGGVGVCVIVMVFECVIECVIVVEMVGLKVIVMDVEENVI